MQRAALWTGIVVFALVLLFPPWHLLSQSYGMPFGDAFHFLLYGAEGSAGITALTIDWQSWVVLLGAIALLTVAVMKALRLKNS